MVHQLKSQTKSFAQIKDNFTKMNNSISDQIETKTQMIKKEIIEEIPKERETKQEEWIKSLSRKIDFIDLKKVQGLSVLHSQVLEISHTVYSIFRNLFETQLRAEDSG